MAFPNANSAIRKAAHNSLRKFPPEQVAQLLSKSSDSKRSSYYEDEEEEEDDDEELHPDQQQVEDPFPRNETIQYDFKIGNDFANVDFQSEIFAGTNWHCNESYFNYEVVGAATSILNIYDFHEEAVGAEFVYGKIAGKPMEDEVSYTLKGQTVMVEDLSFESKQCQENVNTISKIIDPVVREQFTVWSVPVPVNFILNTDLVAGLGYSYDVCDSQLEAKVQLLPDTEAVVTSGVEAEFEHFKFGLITRTQTGAAIAPTSFVELSNCNAGVELDQLEEDIQARLLVTFSVRECEWQQHQWTNCRWQSASETELYEIDDPGAQKVLEQLLWQIPE